jgi:dihydrofolate synthase/folylpolyglutamate synthase
VAEIESLIKLEQFLNKKPLFYKKIDYDRFPKVYNRIRNKLKLPKIIHIVGTNGKGTTGRFLATALKNANYKTGHYTSPHILKFNERIWIDGDDIDDISLEKAHLHLQTLLTKEESNSLSYFEYTTLLAIVCFKDCDYVVLEAGLGGERDATAVFDSILNIATVIDFDHQSFLGSDIKEIARTKLNASKQKLLLAKQKHSEVLEVAKEISKEKNIPLYLVENIDENFVKKISNKLNLVAYLEENLKTAIKALEILGVTYNENSFDNARLFGRLTKFKKNILVDVGHNPLAAKSILNALKPKKYILIYNTYEDKDYKTILKILKPIVKEVEIIDIKQQRVVKKEQLQNTLNQLKIQYNAFKQINDDKDYLVFGSFSVVEEFLKLYE